MYIYDMKYFKTLLILILISLSSIVKSQSTFDFSYDYSWKLSGQGYCGAGNAYCVVIRTKELNSYDTYTYHIYFSSNSFFNNCVAARTYIPNIKVTYFDRNNTWVYPNNFNVFWMTVGKQTLAYTLFHSDPNLKIKVNVGYMTPTIY